ncbi:MAG: DUF6515 family protein [Phycisphaerae bacterium]|nr:DUF6515 family protein [Phycisphaerae bacterium]
MLSLTPAKLLAIALAIAWTNLAAAQDRRERSGVSRGTREVRRVDHSAANGSVARHRPNQQQPTARPTVRPQVRPEARPQIRPEVRPGAGSNVITGRPTGNRFPSTGSPLHHSDRGSVRYHRPGPSVRPVPLPSPVARPIRVQRYPRYGDRIAQLPGGHRVHSWRGRNYYCWDGVYYRPWGGGYVAVRPPIGVRLPFLPDGYLFVTIGGRPFYRYGNTYYVQEIFNNEPTYVVVEPPREAYFDALPQDTREVIHRGRTYFVDIYEEVAYEPIIVDGYTRYRVADIDVDVDFEDGRVEIELDD